MNLKARLHLYEADNPRHKHWIHRFLGIYWLVIGLHFFAQLGAFLFIPAYDIGTREFYLRILLFPHLFMSAFTGSAYGICRFWPRFSCHALSVCGTIISTEIIHLNGDIRIISAAMLLPIMASAIFFRPDVTWFTAGLQGAALLFLYGTDSWFRQFLNPFDLIAIPLFLLVGTMVTGIIIQNGRGIVENLETTTLDKQELMIENVLITNMAKTDALTGLYNHMSFHEFYDKAIDFGSQGHSFHLALLDIDHFKLVNDKYGHRTGDIVLARVAQIIREAIEPTDIAARYGGEEFAVLLFEKSFEHAYAIMETIRERLAELQHEELNQKAITISIGLRSFSRLDTKEAMFEAVDDLLYQAKRAGRNRTVAAVSAKGNR
ncbi:MAG: chemotaxis protein CheY [Paenibacillaceae bacterium]|nr:chemotaxis protein CheY [Paenibacillaceae bacterium]